MQDFLNDFNAIVAEALNSADLSSVVVSAENQRIPEEFPCVTIEETMNATPREYFDSAVEEDYTRLQYRVNVWSNKMSGRRAEARGILSVIDEAIVKHGFNRVSSVPVPDFYRSTVYELTTTYECVISKDGVVYHS